MMERKQPGPNQLAWARKWIRGFAEMEAVAERIRAEVEANRAAMLKGRANDK